MSKIPCSIGVLTLNCADSLAECLESLKDFAEIIVCDGNSTDNTLEIAKQYGAKIIKQYDTDEPNLTCVMDKANVREKNMSARSFDWYFFMDADDTLSAEAVEEIRQIVTQTKPEFLAYRMPTRIFLAGREIKHEATYPSYQLRLVHKDSEAYFKGPVHDHLIFPRSISVGTMSSFYNFHWPAERMTNYWSYLKRYVGWELKTISYANCFQFLNWGIYRRLRTILGYLLYRLPFMYLRFGFRESMPLRIELQIVRYHLALLFGAVGVYWRTRPAVIFWREVWRGKDIYRFLTNIAIMDRELSGRVIDLGGDRLASYYRFFRQTKWQKIVTVNLDEKRNPDLLFALGTGPLPFPDSYFDQVLAFNLLEHLDNREKNIAEMFRLLRDGGELIGVIPFLVNVHPDPNDYIRLTNQGLIEILSGAGFGEIEIRPIGRGPFVAAYSLSEIIWPRWIKIILGPMMIFFDYLLRLVKPKINWQARFPLAYLFVAKK